MNYGEHRPPDDVGAERERERRFGAHRAYSHDVGRGCDFEEETTGTRPPRRLYSKGDAHALAMTLLNVGPRFVVLALHRKLVSLRLTLPFRDTHIIGGSSKAVLAKERRKIAEWRRQIAHGGRRSGLGHMAAATALMVFAAGLVMLSLRLSACARGDGYPCWRRGGARARRHAIHLEVEKPQLSRVVEKSSSQPPRAAPAFSGDYASWQCWYIGHDPYAMLIPEMNSRGLCATGGPVCFDAADFNTLRRFVPSDGAATTCAVQGVGGRRDNVTAKLLEEKLTCEGLKDSLVSHRYGELFDHRNTTWLRDNEADIQWHPPSIVVPTYAYLSNIFHFSRVMLFAAHIFWNSAAYGFADAPLSFHLRFSEIYSNQWNRAFGSTMSSQLLPVFSLRMYDEDKRVHHCFERALLLGNEGRYDALQFLNDTPVFNEKDELEDSHVPPIPIDVLRFKKLFYHALQLKPLPFLRRGFDELDTVKIPAPPLRMAYLLRGARSNRALDSRSGQEFWRLLQNVTEAYDMELKVVSFDGRNFSDQVNEMRDVGFAVGIHGANLHNAIFMPPGGQLFEIFPHNYKRSYYVAGSNSGLRYSSHVARLGKELHCDRFEGRRFMKCMISYRSTQIVLQKDEFEDVYNKLRKAARYLTALHRMGPSITLRRRDNVFHFDREALEEAMADVP